MTSQTDKFNEKNRRTKYLAFLLHLHKVIPTDKFVPLSDQKELEQFSIETKSLPVIIDRKIITIEFIGGEPHYKWTSIRPNIHMVEALVKAEENFIPTPIIEKKEEVEKVVEEKEQPPEVVVSIPIIEPRELRPYQINLIEEIFNKWRQGKKSVLLQMPTGTGKTVLFSDIVRRGVTAKTKRRILIVVHRKELVEQIKKELILREVDAGIIMSGELPDHNKYAQIATIQTFSRREEHPQADLVIIDECHHATADTYKALWDIYPNAKFLGVTATPCRLSGEGFDDVFEELIASMSIKKFIEQKHLVQTIHYACASPNLTSVRKSKGDYETKTLSQAMLNQSVMSDVIETYLEHCKDKSAIAFAVNVEHSKEIVQRFKSKGVNAEHIDATTPRDLRQQILSDFRNGLIKVVSNVEIINEGFDFPKCEAVLLARPTKSLSLYLQMVGRVMRTASNKTEGIILDNAGLWNEHGLSTMDRNWQLSGADKNNRREPLMNKELIAINEDGFIKEINKNRPIEIKGLQLIPLTPEYKRLRYFEVLLSKVMFDGTKKLLSTYYGYRQWAEEGGNLISVDEFKYIMKRLTVLNSVVLKIHSFKNSFWQREWTKFEIEREMRKLENKKLSDARQQTFLKQGGQAEIKQDKSNEA